MARPRPPVAYQVSRSQFPDAQLPFRPSRYQEALIVAENEAGHSPRVCVVYVPKQPPGVRVVRSNLPISPPCEHRVLDG